MKAIPIAGLLIVALIAPLSAETLNILECTFKDSAGKPDNYKFEEMIAHHYTLDAPYPNGVTSPVLFEVTGEMGEPPGEHGLTFTEIRHDQLGIVAAVDLKEEGDPDFGGAQYFDYDRKTGAAQLIAVDSPAKPAQVETGTCIQRHPQ